MKHLFERGVIVIHILEEPLLGELFLGQGLCEIQVLFADHVHRRSGVDKTILVPQV